MKAFCCTCMVVLTLLAFAASASPEEPDSQPMIRELTHIYSKILSEYEAYKREHRLSLTEMVNVQLPQPEEQVMHYLQLGMKELEKEKKDWRLINYFVRIIVHESPRDEIREFALRILHTPAGESPPPMHGYTILMSTTVLTLYPDEEVHNLIRKLLILPILEDRGDIIPYATDSDPFTPDLMRRLVHQICAFLPLRNQYRDKARAMLTEARETYEKHDIYDYHEKINRALHVLDRLEQGLPAVDPRTIPAP